MTGTKAPASAGTRQSPCRAPAKARIAGQASQNEGSGAQAMRDVPNAFIGDGPGRPDANTGARLFAEPLFGPRNAKTVMRWGIIRTRCRSGGKGSEKMRSHLGCTGSVDLGPFGEET